MGKTSEFPGRDPKRFAAAEVAESLSSTAARAQSVSFKKSAFYFEKIEDAFPPADPGLKPFGQDILLQIRTPATITRGGIHIPEESRETDMWNMQAAKVIALGPVAFRNRETLEQWPEGAWCGVGDFVRIPKYGGDRWWVDVPGSVDGKALFVLFKDTDLKGLVPADRILDMVAYI